MGRSENELASPCLQINTLLLIMSSLLPGDLGEMYPMEKYLWPYDFSSKIKSTFQLALYSSYYFFIFIRKHGIHIYLIFEHRR